MIREESETRVTAEDLVRVDATVQSIAPPPASHKMLLRGNKKAEQRANQQQPRNKDHQVHVGKVNTRAAIKFIRNCKNEKLAGWRARHSGWRRPE